MFSMHSTKSLGTKLCKNLIVDDEPSIDEPCDCRIMNPCKPRCSLRGYKPLPQSELFGYEQGVSTVRKQREEGLFEQSQGNTIFVDEIGEMVSRNRRQRFALGFIVSSAAAQLYRRGLSIHKLGLVFSLIRFSADARQNHYLSREPERRLFLFHCCEVDYYLRRVPRVHNVRHVRISASR